MWQRYWNSAWQTLTYDYENRLVSVSGSGTGSFAYDADGNRVWQDVDGTEIHYVWDWVESGTVYYYFGGRKVVMRNVSGLTYLYADQVSSTTNTSNAQPSSQRYYPYGDKRGTNSVVTPYQYTGQRWEDAIGLYFYQARWYDAARRRFIQPDSIVPEPGNPQDLNRYTYARNNPVKYNDPSGHFTPDMAFDIAFILFDIQQIQAEGWTFENTVALVVDLVCLGVPIGTGGGGGFRLAYAGGGEVAQTAIRATREVRAIQGTQKLIQASTGQVATQPPLPGFEDLVGKDLPPGIEAEEKVAKELGIPRAGQKTTLQAPYFTSKSGARQPDFDPALTPGKIVEVKDRERVSLEGNLYDFVEYARRNQLKVELWVRPDTLLSDEILRLWLGDNPLIDVRYIPQ